MPTAMQTAPPVRPARLSFTARDSCERCSVDMPSFAKTAGETLMAK